MAKKKKDVMAKERDAFLYGTETNCGAVKNGVPEEAAKEIFEEMSAFATYAFNKSHAAAYAFLAYQTAYLRKHYYKEYMVALLTSVLDSPAKLMEYIGDLKNNGVGVLPPDINKSGLSFVIEGENLRFGLLAIKNIGRNFINDLINERSGRPFSDITDFIKRMYGKDMNKRAIEYLVKAGAFDNLPHNRRQLITNTDRIYDSVANSSQKNLEGQMGFFDFVDDVKETDMLIPPAEEFPKALLMNFEKEALGFYATGHPLDAYDKYARLNGYSRISDINGENRDSSIKEGGKVRAIVLLSGKKPHKTRNGKQMCFATFEDSTGEIEGIVFDDLYARSSGLLTVNGKPLIVYGTVSDDSEDIKLVVNAIEDGKSIVPCDFDTLFIQMASSETEKLSAVSELLSQHGGKEKVRIAFSDTHKVFALKNTENVNITKYLLEKLSKICGKSNIIVK